MSTTLANSCGRQMDDNQLPKKLPLSSLQLPALAPVASTWSPCLAAISPSGRVHLLHHTHCADKPTPVYRDGSNNIWNFLGVGNFAPVANFNHLALAKPVQANMPSGEAMCHAPDMISFKALVADTNATTWGLTCNAIVPFSPSGKTYQLCSRVLAVVVLLQLLVPLFEL
jgi:hypothetical protein